MADPDSQPPAISSVSVGVIEAPAGEDSLARLIDLEIREGTVDLPVLPEVAVRVQDIIARDGYISEISAVIEREPAFAASILRYANSLAFVGLQEITELRHAVSRLGLHAVEHLILAISTRGAFHGGDPQDEKILRGLWSHSIATAVGARWLARHTTGHNPEQAFLAGLLHDIGKVVILRCLAQMRRRDPARYTLSEPALIECFDQLHCGAGDALFDAWRLPKEIREVVHRHHEPVFEPPGDMLVAIVSFADRAACKVGYSLSPDPGISLLDHPAATIMALNDVELACLVTDIEDDFLAFQESL
jgi:HD-like signal output (HDOD) protein